MVTGSITCVDKMKRARIKMAYLIYHQYDFVKFAIATITSFFMFKWGNYSITTLTNQVIFEITLPIWFGIFEAIIYQIVQVYYCIYMVIIYFIKIKLGTCQQDGKILKHKLRKQKIKIVFFIIGPTYRLQIGNIIYLVLFSNYYYNNKLIR